MKMKKIMVLLLLSVILVNNTVSAEIVPVNENIVMKCGETKKLHFMIYNNETGSLFFIIHISDDDGWVFNITPSSGVLPANSAKAINLTVTAPKVAVKTHWEFSVIIDFYNATGFTHSEKHTVQVTLLTGGTFFFFFTLPLPEELGYWRVFISAALTWIIIAFIIYFIFPIIKKLTKFTKNKLDDKLVDILKKPVTVWVIFYGFVDSILLLPLPITLAELVIEIYNIFVVAVITWIIYRVFKNIVIEYAFHISSKRKNSDDIENILIPVIEKIGVASIILIGGIMALQALGVDITVLIAGMGVMGIIIGFAAQDTLGNFFAGIHILLDRAFKIGDYVVFEGDDRVYIVKDVGLRSTKLYDIFAHTMIFVPNSQIANHKIINLNKPDKKMRIRIDVGVSYDSNIERVKTLLRKIAIEHPNILKNDEFQPVVVFREFGESSLNFTLYAWVDEVENQWAVASELRAKILNTFRKEGITIPFPQLDVHIKN